MATSDYPCSNITAVFEGAEEIPADKITTYDEAIHCGNDILAFLTRKGEEQLLESMFNIIQHLQNDKLYQCSQTSILDYTLLNCTCFHSVDYSYEEQCNIMVIFPLLLPICISRPPLYNSHLVVAYG